ncbi:amidohydrolase/deacetylase family metallohydrolase [Aeromicrobium sp. YIM 150415]|uniref:amidohydrolase/deacetylase family metallohydrolase n=1 Tax=Aeromicrobium sp. YIM 150415 TaxID=2803912 RepID=UPI00196420C6|nr:amidohydrolase/deacetylase family metallohydrolase [Aeromicrobium sp. YIM 150415]MBM9462466.1 amidohydrolase/deacetylase family metallohydrolase [Aeromicrobium sp. YIM 150415]
MNDLLLRNALVHDPSTATSREAHVAIDAGTIVSLDASDTTPARHVLDVEGAHVLPGLIDLHTHYYRWSTPLGYDPRRYSFRDGVTTIVDAGSAGALTLPGLVQTARGIGRGNLFAFVNLSTIGIIHNEVGELHDLRTADIDLLAEAIEENRDFVVGIKLRLSRWVNGENPGNAREALRRALAAGERTGVPLMVHVFDPSLALIEILDALRPGDIVTHVFSRSRESVVASQENWDALLRARARGVVLDVGCGRGGLDFSVGREAIARGLYPDTISSDLTEVTADGPVFGLTATMSKMLAIGMPFEEVLRAVTINPATVLRRPELAELREGAVANLAVLAVERGSYEFEQLQFLEQVVETVTHDQSIRALATVLEGRVVVGDARLSTQEA